MQRPDGGRKEEAPRKALRLVVTTGKKEKPILLKPTASSSRSIPPWLSVLSSLQSEATLRASLMALGLPVDGDKATLARRLAAACATSL